MIKFFAEKLGDDVRDEFRARERRASSGAEAPMRETKPPAKKKASATKKRS